MKALKHIIILTILFTTFNLKAQTKVESEVELKHYMPLYLDIPAEMNVKKGYKEANIALEYADFKNYRSQRALLEYDFAPINKLGFEIEVPFSFTQNKHQKSVNHQEVGSVEEGSSNTSAMALRLGFNYALFSSKEAKTSVSIGYFNEFEFTPFAEFGKPLFEANVYNPFVAVAKIWGDRFHTMVYTGTATKQSFEHHDVSTAVRFNTILSYRFGKALKENFFAVESNQVWQKEKSGQMVLRPQLQLEVAENFKLGFVASFPVNYTNQLNASGFMRVIYTPKNL